MTSGWISQIFDSAAVEIKFLDFGAKERFPPSTVKAEI